MTCISLYTAGAKFRADSDIENFPDISVEEALGAVIRMLTPGEHKLEHRRIEGTYELWVLFRDGTETRQGVYVVEGEIFNMIRLIDLITAIEGEPSAAPLFTTAFTQPPTRLKTFNPIW